MDLDYGRLHMLSFGPRPSLSRELIAYVPSLKEKKREKSSMREGLVPERSW